MATTQLLFEASASVWSVAALFFGLWLIPMGYVLLTTDGLTIPASIGEFWMIGYLLVFGVRAVPRGIVEGVRTIE